MPCRARSASAGPSPLATSSCSAVYTDFILSHEKLLYARKILCNPVVLSSLRAQRKREKERTDGRQRTPAADGTALWEGKVTREMQVLVSDYLCRQFYSLGWANKIGHCIATKFPGGVAFRSCHIVAMPTYGELIPKERMLPLKGVSTKQLQHKNRHRTSSVRAVSLSGSNSAEQSRRCIVLDIEGATTPISFVTDVLFPYARDNVRKHLMSTYDSDETKEDIKLLREQVEDDLKNGVVGSVPIPSDEAGKEEIIDSLVTNVQAMIKADRKLTSLKQLQGHIWRTGFENKELQGIVYEDVPEALQKWHAHGIKVYIYSSGSREAQRLIFGNTPYGDLRKYLCGFFDTTIGYKRESRSYFEISQSVGVDKPSQVLFVTDVYQEAVAAKAAGLEVLISIRPGNAPLPENHGFGTITSFAEIKPQ